MVRLQAFLLKWWSSVMFFLAACLYTGPCRTDRYLPDRCTTDRRWQAPPSCICQGLLSSVRRFRPIEEQDWPTTESTRAEWKIDLRPQVKHPMVIWHAWSVWEELYNVYRGDQRPCSSEHKQWAPSQVSLSGSPLTGLPSKIHIRIHIPSLVAF